MNQIKTIGKQNMNNLETEATEYGQRQLTPEQILQDKLQFPMINYYDDLENQYPVIDPYKRPQARSLKRSVYPHLNC